MKNFITSANTYCAPVAGPNKGAQAVPQTSLFLKGAALLCAGLLSAYASMAQVAPVNPPAGGFHIDGNLDANIPTANIGDWVSGAGGSGGFVLSGSGVSTVGTSAARVQDAYNSNDIIFTQGSKFNDNPNNWAWTTGSAPDKNDIHNGMYLVTKDPSNLDWLIIAGDRLSTNGTSYIDFELLQDSVYRNTNNNGFTAPGPHGGRRVNDLVISMEYSNGGSKPKVIIYRWVAMGGGRYGYQILPMTTPVNAGLLSDYAFAETNRNGSVHVPFGAFGNTSYKSFAFVEAAVNMTKVIGAMGNACDGLSIKTVFIKTKASDSFTAALKDMMEPISVTMNFGSASISYGGPYCPVGTATVTLGSGSVTGGTFSASPAGLSINAGTGAINLAASSAGTYTVTYSYTTNGCEKTATTQVTVKALSSVSAFNNGPLCAGTTLNLSAAPSSGTYSWEGPNSFTSASQTPSISSATSANAGTYTVHVTVNGCTASGTTSVTVNAIPGLPTVSPIGFCKDATATQLSATGTNLLWYANATGGTGSATAPTPSTATVGTTSYYVSQTSTDGCESGRAQLEVTINASPAEPTLSIINPSCSRILGEITVLTPDPASGLYQFSNDNFATYNTTGVFTFAAGAGYSIKARPIADITCVSLAATCTADPDFTQPARVINNPVDNKPEVADKADLTVYPNPFSMNSTLEFRLEKDGQAELSVFDMSGRLVKRVFSANAEAGITYRTGLDGSAYGDGVYIARLTVNGKVLNSIRIVHQK